MGLIDSFKRLNCLVAVFLFISVLSSLMGKKVKSMKGVLDENEAKVLYEGVMPAAHAITQIMVSSALVAAVGALYEVGSFRDYTLGRWSADAAVGSYVYTALFTFVTNHGPNGDVGDWVAPIAATFFGTLIIYLRDQKSLAFVDEDAAIAEGARFVCIFFATLFFKAAATGFLLSLRTDAISYHDAWGGLVAELLAALVAKQFSSKYDTGLGCMILTVLLMVIYDQLVIEGFDKAVPFMLFVTGVAVKLTTSLLREAGGLLNSKTGMPIGNAILGVDVATTFGVISGHILTNFWDWGRLYLLQLQEILAMPTFFLCYLLILKQLILVR